MSLITKAAVAGTAATSVVIADAGILGIDPNVLLASFAGAFLGLAYSPPETWTKLIPDKNSHLAAEARKVGFQLVGLLFSILANGIVMGWAVTIAPNISFLSAVRDVPPEAAAGVLAFFAQHLLPKVALAVGARITSWGAPK